MPRVGDLNTKIIKLLEDKAMSRYCDSWTIGYRQALRKLLSADSLDGIDGAPALVTVSDKYQCCDPKTLVRRIANRKAYLLANAMVALAKEGAKH